MIRRVWSSLASFREAHFDALGLNVVLANRAEDSDETESTNGLGKTTLLRIIHFVLGSDLSKDRVLGHPDLAGVTFGLDLEIAGVAYSIRRNTSSSDIVHVPAILLADMDVDWVPDGADARMGIDVWRSVLSMLFVPDTRKDTDATAFSPSFRELALYFIRLGRDAFVDPIKAFGSQSGPSKRLAASYLLGMNWAVQRRMQALAAERDRVGSAVKALGEAQDGSEEPSIGDLEADRVVLEKAVQARRAEVAGFNLRSDYHDLERRLDQADRTLHDLINENYSDRRLLRYYEESAVETPLFDGAEPAAILADAGALFRPEALRTLAEVDAFHKQVYHNRAAFLAAEVQRLKAGIAERTRRIDSATGAKSQLLGILNSSGAMETLVELQRTTMEMSAALEALKARIEERKRFDRRKDDLTADLAAARKLLKQDLEDRRATADEAIELFAEFTSFLYGRAGRLGIDVGQAGYSFTFSIDRQGSDGVDQMVVFCFDLMVATLRARRDARFNALIHDSSLFADVDPRQFGLALQLAASVSLREGFQYICCLNEGALPNGHLGPLDFDEAVKLHLTDDGDGGRLLGIRLPPPDVTGARKS